MPGSSVFSDIPIEEVRRYWDNRPCNVRHSTLPVGTREYYDQVGRPASILLSLTSRASQASTAGRASEFSRLVAALGPTRLTSPERVPMLWPVTCRLSQ